MAAEDPHEAAQIGHDALETVSQIRSHRILDNLQQLHSTSARHAQIPEVAQLQDRIDTEATA